MTKVKSIGSNQTEIHYGDNVFLFSYETLVAAYLVGSGWLRTEKKWSKTTSKHINQWIPNGVDARTIPQEDLESLFV